MSLPRKVPSLRTARLARTLQPNSKAGGPSSSTTSLSRLMLLIGICSWEAAHGVLLGAMRLPSVAAADACDRNTRDARRRSAGPAVIRGGLRAAKHEANLSRGVRKVDRDAGEQRAARRRHEEFHAAVLEDEIAGLRRRFDAEFPGEARAAAGRHDETEPGIGDSAHLKHAPDEFLGSRGNDDIHAILLKRPADNAAGSCRSRRYCRPDTRPCTAVHRSDRCTRCI